ncbi:hypothetical protein Shyhy02_70730 [Streptomyces hygroscopicus subsp. hygroscopicus]|nr:hypothetical protein Shyhy02_70730 [Streptomyces hygroscopicus subsp. hygroscopicus]
MAAVSPVPAAAVAGTGDTAVPGRAAAVLAPATPMAAAAALPAISTLRRPMGAGENSVMGMETRGRFCGVPVGSAKSASVNSPLRPTPLTLTGRGNDRPVRGNGRDVATTARDVENAPGGAVTGAQ